MLTLTKTASEAVRGIVANSPELPDDTAGLRLVGEQGSAGELQIKVNAVRAPAEGDQVIEEQAARVFLEGKLATELDDAILDAEMVGRGIGFKIVADA